MKYTDAFILQINTGNLREEAEELGMCLVTTTRGVGGVGMVRPIQFLFIQFTNCSACLCKASVGNAK